jgi:hypothetical protein
VLIALLGPVGQLYREDGDAKIRRDVSGRMRAGQTAHLTIVPAELFAAAQYRKDRKEDLTCGRSGKGSMVAEEGFEPPTHGL